MSRMSRRVVALMLACVGALALIAGGAFAATRHAHRFHRGLSVRQVMSATHGQRQRVIVLLRDQHTALPPTRADAKARAAVLSADQRPLLAAVRASGGHVNDRYRTLNAVAVTVSSAERANLASNAAVSEVLPDARVANPDPNGGDFSEQPLATPKASPAPADQLGPTAPDGQQICPTNPNQPIVAPEGRSLINADQADQIADGKGVTIGFVADGLDVDNPDFIRPDGSHVITDYRDFSGDGLDAETSGGEAFGDASTMAAQGRVTYDLSTFVNPVHQLPANCDIVIKGVAPGASLAAMKVFGNASSAFFSVIVQGEDWAVFHDHVDILNESLGGDPLPDTDQDVSREFNALAVRAGVTVTESSGDQGTANTIGSPASGSETGGSIDVGATTQFQGLAQTVRGGYQLQAGGWANDNIANFSSSGFTQGGATVDLVAPGNESFEPCTPNSFYDACFQLGTDTPSPVSTFGGTSESSPFTAGVAALVIEAYRNTHHGQTPSPALVKQIITSTADDLDIPSDEQGAGELNALAAVQAAESVGSSQATGQQRLVSPDQLDLSANAGTGAGSTVRLTNTGAQPETYHSRLRTLGSPVSDVNGSVTLDPTTDQTFFDHLGVQSSYVPVHFTVPTGVDRIDASIAWPSQTTTVNMVLFDPQGKMTAFTYTPDGATSAYSHVDVRNPPAGDWTAYIYTPTSADDGDFTGAVQYEFSTSRFVSTGSVSPSSVTLAPGQSTALQVSLSAPAPAGDYSRDVEISGSSGKTTIVPVVMRSLVNLSHGSGSFAGTIHGGDSDGAVGEEDTFAFDVPRGAPAIDSQMEVANDPGTQLLAFLVSPDGQTLATQESVQDSSGDQLMQVFHDQPAAGRWTLVLLTLSPVGGASLGAPLTGTVTLRPPAIGVSGIPGSGNRGRPAVLAPGQTATGSVTVHNPGNAPLTVILDARLHGSSLYSLAALTQPTGLTLPLAGTPPLFGVPTQTTSVVAAARSARPIEFDWGFIDGDPDLLSTSGTSASGAQSSPEVTVGVWDIAPALVGPFATQTAPATVDTGMVARTRTFDQNVTTGTGDPQLGEVGLTDGSATPVTIDPGQSAQVPVTITAPTKAGTVSGDLYVDDFDEGDLSANDIGSVPYRYTVATPKPPHHGGHRHHRHGRR
jgi:hypothetical protein